MTEHEPGDIVGLFVDKVQIEVANDDAKQANSYQTISWPGEETDDATATVTVEAERTFFRFRGDTFLFDGVTYRPNSDYRDDDEHTDGEVSLVYPDGFYPDEGHPFNPVMGWFTLDDFVNMLVDGELEPTTNPDGVHG